MRGGLYVEEEITLRVKVVSLGPYRVLIPLTESGAPSVFHVIFKASKWKWLNTYRRRKAEEKLLRAISGSSYLERYLLAPGEKLS